MTVFLQEQFNRQRDETQHGGVHYLQQNLIGQHSGVSGGGAEFNGGAIMPFLPAPNPLMRGLMTPNAMFCRAHTLEQFAAENFYSSNGPLKQEFAESAIAVGVVEDEEGNVVKCSNGSSLVAGECGGKAVENLEIGTTIYCINIMIKNKVDSNCVFILRLAECKRNAV